jgi:hypothetical protein
MLRLGGPLPTAEKVKEIAEFGVPKVVQGQSEIGGVASFLFG